MRLRNKEENREFIKTCNLNSKFQFKRKYENGELIKSCYYKFKFQFEIKEEILRFKSVSLIFRFKFLEPHIFSQASESLSWRAFSTLYLREASTAIVNVGSTLEKQLGTLV